jgi:hypothetical protein
MRLPSGATALGIAAALCDVGGFGLGYLVARSAPNPGAVPLTVQLAGVDYNVVNVSWMQPLARTLCPNGTTPSELLLDMPSQGALFSITQNPADCAFDFPSYAYSVNVSYPVLSARSGYALTTSNGNVGVEHSYTSWTNLTVLLDNGAYGVIYVPDPGLSGVVSSDGGALMTYTFWLISRA